LWKKSSLLIGQWEDPVDHACFCPMSMEHDITPALHSSHRTLDYPVIAHAAAGRDIKRRILYTPSNSPTRDSEKPGKDVVEEVVFPR
jgi:hypothetical protein